jgi:hypothetical protein
MAITSGNPAAGKLLQALEGLFENGQAFLLPHQHLTFVCGARPTTESTSLRTDFLSYLSSELGPKSILPILAEKAIDEFLDSGTETAVELGKFENLIAGCVDSILIFPESPGSFAELGFFAANPQVYKKTLIATKEEYQGNSFINLGLMPIFNQYSIYKPMLVLGANLNDSFNIITERLQLIKSNTKYKKRFPTDSFKTLEVKHQLIALYELIRVLGYVTEHNLFSIIQSVFKSYELEIVHRLLAILMAMNFVNRNEHGDYLSSSNAPSLLEYANDLFDKAKLQAITYYKKHEPEALIAQGGT